MHVNLTPPTYITSTNRQLFHLVTSNFSQDNWFSMFKTSNDLSTFLKLFSDCFHIQSNLVTLLQKPKLSDAYIQQAQNRTRDQSNNNFVNSSNYNRIQTPATRTVSNNNAVGDFKLNEPVSNMNVATTTNNVKSEPNSGFDSFVPDLDMKLENLCENNCPKSCSSSSVSSPVSSISPASSPISNNNDRTVSSNKNQTLKQRINSLVMKNLRFLLSLRSTETGRRGFTASSESLPSQCTLHTCAWVMDFMHKTKSKAR